MRIAGVRDRIELREVSRGLYVGRYVLKRADRVEDDAEVRAILRAGNRTGAANYALADVMSDRPPVAVAPPVPAPPVVPLRIERFTVAPLDRIEPGAELRFALDAVPGATVVVDLPGVASDLALREVRPGRYEGAYTLRRADNLNVSRPVVATLRAGDRSVTASVAIAPVQPSGDNRAPQLVNLSPREGEVIPGSPNIQISAGFEDQGGSGVDPSTVRIGISGRNVTQDAQITPNGFTYRAGLPPGRHTVDVAARDRAGNAVRREWSFEVAAAVPVKVPLQVLSHANNSQVAGAPTAVQGRTAPFASVAVTVDAVAPVPGGFSVAQRLSSQTVQADGNGNFSFSFSPRFAIPGARYDVVMVATKANINTDAKLTLYQR